MCALQPATARMPARTAFRHRPTAAVVERDHPMTISPLDSRLPQRHALSSPHPFLPFAFYLSLSSPPLLGVETLDRREVVLYRKFEE